MTAVLRWPVTTVAGAWRRALVRSIPAAGYSRFAQGELSGTHSPTGRLGVTASMATEQMYGRPFC